MQKRFLNILNQSRAQGHKKLAVLIDPDSQDAEHLVEVVHKAEKAEVDFYFVGGSLLLKDALEETLRIIKKNTAKPVMIFPGSIMQVSSYADGILFLSLISGRNPDLLIGQQVMAAPYIKQAHLETVATGYMLIESGRSTTASYMSHSLPIPAHKPEIAACTALAGQYLGMHMIYMDGGSGADKTITPDMVQAVHQMVDIPLTVGGGIRSAQEAEAICNAGADLIVVGNAFESDPELMHELTAAVHRL